MYQAFKGVPLLRFFGDNNGTMGHYPSLTIERCGLVRKLYFSLKFVVLVLKKLNNYK